jgi:quinol monooxygenase YgiN
MTPVEGRDDAAGSDRGAGSGEADPVLVTMRFESDRPDDLLDVLAPYVVLARTHPGCRNVDLVASVTVPGRFLVVQKWTSPADQRRHFDSDVLATLAEGCRGLLREPAELDLYDGVTMHDLA